MKEPSIKQLAQLLDVKECEVAEAIISTQSVTSLSCDIQNAGEKSVELIEQLASLKNESDDTFNHLALDDALMCLGNKERYIIEKLFDIFCTKCKVSSHQLTNKCQCNKYVSGPECSAELIHACGFSRGNKCCYIKNSQHNRPNHYITLKLFFHRLSLHFSSTF